MIQNLNKIWFLLGEYIKRSRYYDEYINEIVYYKGQLYKTVDVYEGDEDQSYHGSPWYDNYIVLENIKTNETITLCFMKDNFKIATAYIKHLKEKIEDIKNVVSFIDTRA